MALAITGVTYREDCGRLDKNDRSAFLSWSSSPSREKNKIVNGINTNSAVSLRIETKQSLSYNWEMSIIFKIKKRKWSRFLLPSAQQGLTQCSPVQIPTPPVFGPSEYWTYHALCVSEIWTLSLKSVITVQKINVANVQDKVVCMYKQAVCVISSSVHISLNQQGIHVISRPPVFVFCSVFFCFSSSTQHLISTDWWWTECSILWINRFALKLYACNRFFLLYLSNHPGYWASTRRARLQQAASQPCIWPEVKN